MDNFSRPPSITRVSHDKTLGNFCKECGKLCESPPLLLVHKSSHIKFEITTDRYCFLCGSFCSNGITDHLVEAHWKMLDKVHFQPVKFQVAVKKLPFYTL